MTDIILSAKELRGTINPPPFKSEVIRYLILASLCGIRPSAVLEDNYQYCSDIFSAVSAVDAVMTDPKSVIPVGDSAALLRILAPILLTNQDEALFSVGESLYRRVLYPSTCGGLRCDKRCSGDERLIKVSERIRPGHHIVDGSASSQTASGFLIACALEPGLEVRIDSPVSIPYIELTKRMLSEFCVDLSMTDDGYYKASEPRITAPKTCSFEADYSYVANFIAANYIMTGRTSSPIHFFGDAPVEQPDYLIHDLIFQSDTTVRNCPDLFPILCVSALKRRGDTVIREISRLKQKESNRVESTAQMIKALGGRVDMFNDRVVIHGTGGRLAGGTVDSFGDHRIVMAAAVAALMCDNSIMIKNAGVVEKSAPKFFDDFVKLGGTVHEYVRE